MTKTTTDWREVTIATLVHQDEDRLYVTAEGTDGARIAIGSVQRTRHVDRERRVSFDWTIATPERCATGLVYGEPRGAALDLARRLYEGSSARLTWSEVRHTR